MSTTTTEESLGTRIEQALRHRFSERSAAAERYGSEFVDWGRRLRSTLSVESSSARVCSWTSRVLWHPPL